MSKELEAFTRIMETYGKTNSLEGTYDDFLIIKKALVKAQEQEKVLKIIKEKQVSIFQLSCCKYVISYNDLKFRQNEKITEEEFNLLKEYFK